MKGQQDMDAIQKVQQVAADYRLCYGRVTKLDEGDKQENEMTVRDAIKTEEMNRIEHQHGQLGVLIGCGWVETRFVIDNARDLALHYPMSVCEVLDKMIEAALGGLKFAGWEAAKGRFIWEACNE